jgi:hypothetical protein
MTSTVSDTKKYWLFTLISVAACFAFLALLPEWFWVTLPFVFTYYVKANDWM